MNTNLNMTESRINGAALQILLASKNAAAVVSFENETGWSWRDACTTALEAGTANLLASKSDAEIADFEAATGWKWSDAVDEAILAETEANSRASRRGRRLFGTRH